MYEPTPVPEAADPTLRAWLGQQLRQIAAALEFPRVPIMRLEPRGAEPIRYSDGDLVYANGVDWNPGSGAGVYARVSGAWVKL